MKRKIFTGAGKPARVMIMAAGFVALVPALALAAPAAAASSAPAVAKYLAAGGTMAVAALSAAFAQAKIGAAAAGTIAERPETATMMIVLQALPEIIVLLGFVTSLLIVNSAG
jgi:V/A-type H+-transporting ATPase subunit K